MLKVKLLIINIIWILNLEAQPLKNYQFFSKNGEKVEFSDVLKVAGKSDMIFFGELHDNPIIHWLELKITKELYQINKENLVIGAEMFETDDQIKIDEYFSGLIKTKNFEKETRLWPNYKTDYKPILEFAKHNKIKFIATNIPRRYASFVSKNGIAQLKQLSKQAQKYCAPIPIKVDMNLKGYKQIENMGKKHGMKFIAQSQASKDATMAYFSLKNWKKGKILVHLNGTYHSNNYEGIVWFIKNQKPKIKITTISSVQQSDIENINKSNLNLADFILVVDEDMTKTY